MGGVEIVVTLFMVSAYLLVQPDPAITHLRIGMAVAIISVGVLTLFAAKIPALYRFARLVAAASAVTVTGILIWSLLLMTQFDPTAHTLVPGQVTLITLVLVAAIPLRPTDVLLFGS